ncbi:serine hydrolase [Duganella sp. CY15W]|uniref:serine hydrolase n=1 Tax=Duganella sp. CY15W TaxID=2692172 RepID=UPI00136ADC3E|nr:serine hydrolase [Duganella sp. CY15W]MYM31142.1 serine hydrolase [Duganella sp. CY15W]
MCIFNCRQPGGPAQRQVKRAAGDPLPVFKCRGQSAGRYPRAHLRQHSFGQLVRQRIAAPLGMQDTFAEPGARQASRVAVGYDDNGVRQSGADAGFQAAGGLKSSLPDMLRYARWQLNESDAVVRLSHQPTYASDDYAVGLNWQMLRADCRPC